MTKHFGESWKTTLAGYLLAIFLAVQPLLDYEVDLSNKHDRNKYIVRIIFAALVALFGKYAADSGQVKKVDARVDDIHDDAIPTLHKRINRK